jgi:hypothetical protein
MRLLGPAALILAAWLLAMPPSSARAQSTPSADTAAAVVYALESAIDSGNTDQVMRLFTPDARVTDSAVYSGSDQVQDWLSTLLSDRVWLDVTDGPEISPSTGQPLPGYWALAPVTISRASYRRLAVDPMPATLAAIVQGDQIAYLAVRPDMLWMREYQSAKVLSVYPPVPAP